MNNIQVNQIRSGVAWSSSGEKSNKFYLAKAASQKSGAQLEGVYTNSGLVTDYHKAHHKKSSNFTQPFITPHHLQQTQSKLSYPHLAQLNLLLMYSTQLPSRK